MTMSKILCSIALLSVFTVNQANAQFQPQLDPGGQLQAAQKQFQDALKAAGGGFQGAGTQLSPEQRAVMDNAVRQGGVQDGDAMQQSANAMKDAADKMNEAARVLSGNHP
jgi:uncharacterized membrane protein